MKRIEDFAAVSASGEEFRVVAYQHESAFGPLSGAGKMLAGPVEFMLEDGAAVSPLGDDDFEIVQTGQRIRRKRDE
jgi:hypothetical protein